MSRAFVKEPDGATADAQDVLPDRPISPHPNFVTPRGLALIEGELARLQAELAVAREKEDRGAIARISRDLRYWQARRGTAEVVQPVEGGEQVRFGMRVTLERENGGRQTFRIVGQDEADPAKGLISYVSPLARALIGAGVGDLVNAGPGGEAEIVAIDSGGSGAEGEAPGS